MKKLSSIQPHSNEQMRCALLVESSEQHIFVGCTNGYLLRLDPINYFTTLEVKLQNHIFCMLQLDEETLLCGQLKGYLDLVRITDG